MPGVPNFKKIAKTIKIFAVAQVGLIAMLIYMAILFQQKLQMAGKSGIFMNVVVIAFLIQLALFFPIYKFSGREVERDLSLTSEGLGTEELKALLKKKRMSDIIKGTVFCFFAMFILQAPSVPQVLSLLYFSFILTILTYLQCYNFAAKKLMRQESAPRS